MLIDLVNLVGKCYWAFVCRQRDNINHEAGFCWQ